MALGHTASASSHSMSTFMSTALAQASSSSTSANASTSTDSGDNDSKRGASYFFGFLVTFVVLLIVFVSGGIVTRRRMLRRRRGFASVLDWGPPAPWVNGGAMFLSRTGPRGELLNEPKFCDVYVPESMKCWKGCTWFNLQVCFGVFPYLSYLYLSDTTHLQPMSGIYGPAVDVCPKSSTSENNNVIREELRPTHTRSPNPQALNGLSLPSYVRAHHQRPGSAAQKPSDSSSEQSSSLQLSFIVAMPQPPRRRQALVGEEGCELDEYQIGVAQVPWGRDRNP